MPNIRKQCKYHHLSATIGSFNNDRAAIGFNTDHAPKNRYRHIDVHFYEADVVTREIPEARYNELYSLNLIIPRQTVTSETSRWKF